MATRAEIAKAKMERSGPKRAKKVVRPKKGHEEETVAPPAHEARGEGNTAERNESRHAAKKATFALDDSATTASRKSTRKSSNHSKNESNLRLRAVRKTRSADSRAAKANVPAEKPAPKKIPSKKTR